MDNIYVDDLFARDFDEILSTATNTWLENRKNSAEVNGESRAYGELAFREKLISVKSEKVGKSEKFLWITVNPIKGTSLPNIIRAVRKMYQKAWIQKYAYVYETTSNNHMHSHGLIKCKYEYKRAVKELGNTVKDICDINNTHCFKVIVVTEDVAMQKMLYLLGKKKLEKMPDVELTRAWRKEEKLCEIYQSKEAPILLASSETASNENMDNDILTEPPL